MSLINRAANILRSEGAFSLLRKSLAYVENRVEYSLVVVLRRLVSLLPRDDTLWAFGDGVGGRERRGRNSKYLFLQLAKSDETDEHEMVWVSRKDGEVETLKNSGYTAYGGRSLKGIYSILRAKKIFCTNGMDFSWVLTGGAEIVQLWHGNPIKKAGWDVARHRSMNRSSVRHRRRVVWNWDYLITTSKNPPADVLRRAFDVEEENTFVTGFPRTDPFFKDVENVGLGTNTRTVRFLDGLPERSTVFMYAPTWRRDHGERNTNPLRESGIDFDRLEDVLKDTDSYLLVKLHPYTDVSEDVRVLERVLITKHDIDPFPLLERVDALITDYSSIYIDYLLLNRPMIFFPYDLDRYAEKEGLYYEYESITPGFTATDVEQLYEKIGRIASGEDPHQTERAVICELYHKYKDGQSATRIYNSLT